MRALIDLDMPCHEIGHIHLPTGEEDVWTGKPIKELMDLEAMKPIAHGRLFSIIAGSKCAAYNLYVTVGANFRHRIATIKGYKAHRVGMPRHHTDSIKTMFREEYDVEVCSDYEADDAMAMYQYQDLKAIADGYGSWDETVLKEEANTVICSRDKDLDTTPGWRFKWYLKNSKWPDGSPRTDLEVHNLKGDTYWVTAVEAARNFYKQLIEGDTADNIHGLYGKGPTNAWYKQLNDMETPEEMYEHVADKYYKYYRDYWKKFIIENGRLLHMLRSPDDEWKPPTDWEPGK